ncbi:MAG: Ig-like domain-containing protein [Alistipes sp.]
MQKNSQNRVLHLMSVALVGIFIAAFFIRCASMMTPTGGPIDTLPPVIVSMLPDNLTTHFTDRKIYIEFNEFVQLKDQHKEFFTSPQMKKKPQLAIRGRGVVIQLKDTLKENTTYALNFGSSLRDNNEGNPLYSMRYVFSTGAEIDSMIGSAYTADSYKADSVAKSYLYFFIADSVEHKAAYDSTLFKYKPAVIARAETNGICIAQNLKPIPYRVYAFADKNDNQMYDPSVDMVGFIDTTYNPIEQRDFSIWYDSIRRYVTADPQLYFRMFTDVSFRRQLLQQSDRPLQHKAMLYFASAHPTIKSLVFDSIPADRVIIDPQTVGKDTLALWFNLPSAQLPDTIRGAITYLKHDSISVLQTVTEPLALAWKFMESKEQQKVREKNERAKSKAEAAGETWKEPKVANPFAYKFPLTGDVNPESYLTMEFDYPLATIDSAAVRLTLLETDKEEQPVPIHFMRDTANLRHWHLVAPWKTSSKYKLLIPPGAITDVAGFSNDSISGSYNSFDPEKFAMVKLQLQAKDKGSKYIVQLLNATGTLLQEKTNLSDSLVLFNYVPAGEIQFRVIEDENGNGKWDTGNLVERREPERAEIYTDEKGLTVFATKVNWEFEVTMDMNKLFAPVTMESLIDLLDKREVQRLQKATEKRATEKNPKSKGDQNSNNQGNQGNQGFGGAMGGMGGMFNGRGGNNTGTIQSR